MRIERIRLFEVSLGLRHSFETSSHRKSRITHLLVEATSSDGERGWGEIATPADPYFGPETTSIAWHVATRYLVPAVVGEEWDSPADLETLWSRIRGHEFAKAGFVGAAWDLSARSAGRSLAEALGAPRQSVRAGVSLGMEPSIDTLLAEVDRHVRSGYDRVKLKIAPTWDVTPVREVRRVYPELDLQVDANGAYPDTAEAMEQLLALDNFGLLMIEQPFAPREFAAHSRLQAKLETPICLDESIVELSDLQTMLMTAAARVLNIKVSRMGGLTRARAVHDLAGDAGIPVWCGGMHEFGVGRATNIAFAALEHCTFPSDVSGSDKYYLDDIVDPPITANDGVVSVPTGPGIGHHVNTAAIEQLATRVFDSHTEHPPAGRVRSA